MLLGIPQAWTNAESVVSLSVPSRAIWAHIISAELPEDKDFAESSESRRHVCSPPLTFLLANVSIERKALLRRRASQIFFTSVPHVRIFAFLMFWFGLDGESYYQHVAKFHRLQFCFCFLFTSVGKAYEFSVCSPSVVYNSLPTGTAWRYFVLFLVYNEKSWFSRLSGTSDYSIKFYFLEHFPFCEDIICLFQWIKCHLFCPHSIKMWPSSCLLRWMTLTVRWSVSA